MNNRNLIMAAVLLLAGCATTDAVYQNYNNLVNKADGIDAQEAKIVAQKQILDVQEKRSYRVTAPDIKTGPQAQKYPDYWFVVFGHNWFSPISTDPTAKTYTDLKSTQYLVVIEKKTGDIKFSGEWYQKRENNFDWIFDMDAYKTAHPLSLPPGEKGTPASY